MRSNRPPYILAHNADQAGCGFHRMTRPLEVFTQTGVAAGRTDITIWPTEFLQQLNPDVVVWQRQHENEQMEHMKRYRDVLKGSYFVYEIDDALSAVPEWSFHKPYIPVDVDERMAKAIEHVDVVTVSTQALKNHMQSIIGSSKSVRVVPNMLSTEDFASAESIRNQTRQERTRLRIGWGGGVSHKGDLDIIIPLIEAFSGHIDFVFLGMKPDTSVPVEFHLGVEPRSYLQKLASLDLDLMIAPLEDNLFNRCKSNLRLIEAGACGYPVIASPVEPYLEINPPVVSYAEPSAEAWISAIRTFKDMSPAERAEHGKKLASWARRHFNMTERVHERLQGWLRRGAKTFKPRLKSIASKTLTVVCAHPLPGLSQLGHVVPTMREALETTGDILYLKPNISIHTETVLRMRKRLAAFGTERVASVVPISNDGGVAGFPRPGMFSPIDPSQGGKLDELCATTLSEMKVKVQYPIGPAILISRAAIDACGEPEILDPQIMQVSLMDWGAMVASRGFVNAVATDAFVTSLEPIQPQLLQAGAQRSVMRWPPAGLPDDPLVDARERLEIAFHRDSYKSALPSEKPTYEEWCSLFDTLGPRDLDALAESAANLRVKPNFHVVMVEPKPVVEEQTYPNVTYHSEADIDGLLDKVGDNDWVVFTRPNSVVRAHALSLFAAEIAKSDKPDEPRLIYADHDVLSDEGVRKDHYFKTHYDQDMLLCHDYITQLCTVRGDAVKAAGIVNGTHVEAYRIALHTVRNSTRNAIKHVPRILTHLRQAAIADDATTVKIKAMMATDHIIAQNWNGFVTEHPHNKKYAMVRWQAPDPQPLVSIIIPTKDRVEMLSPCISTVLTMTRYRNFEILIIENNATNPAMLDYLKGLDDPRVRIIPWHEPYNWSALNNFAVGHANGQFYCFLNDDTRIVSPEWLDEMVGAAARPHIGAVGARLIYPNGLLQHIGVIAIKGQSGHIQKGTPDGAEGYHGYPLISHECSAVTGACLLVSKERFEDAERFEEALAHNFNDVAFCLELLTLGFTNVLAANANLQHLEGATRLSTASPQGMEILQRESRMVSERYPFDDLYWNKNLKVFHTNGGAMVQGLSAELLSWPPEAWPWRGAEWEVDRVLLIGRDPGTVQREAREGNIVYALSADGLEAKIVHPPLDNVKVWSFNNPDRAREILELLGVRRIVLSNIEDTSIELLPFLSGIGLDVEYQPISAQAVCPRGNFETPEGKCESGWKDPATCQACVLKHGSPFGMTSIIGWRDAWQRFLSAATLRPERLSPDAHEALEAVYGNR